MDGRAGVTDGWEIGAARLCRCYDPAAQQGNHLRERIGNRCRCRFREKNALRQVAEGIIYVILLEKILRWLRWLRVVSR